MIIMHPIFLLISFLCAVIFVVINQQKIGSMYLVPAFVAAAIINPLFNHKGEVILLYLPGGNPLTFESIVYGVYAGVLLISMILWFRVINEVMTSDKWIYLFGRVIPSLSLLISMSLQFIPRFISIIRETATVQKYAGYSISDGSIIVKVKNCGKILSASATRIFDDAIYTSDSMKSRGYGIKKRTNYSIFRFSVRDAVICSWFVSLGAYVAIGKISGAVKFYYFPLFTDISWSLYSITVFFAYFMLCITPVILIIGEKLKWRFINSKM
jgi:energy-coupling factor transport system permease protein